MLYFYLSRWHENEVRRMYRAFPRRQATIVPRVGDNWMLWTKTDSPTAIVEWRVFGTECQDVHLYVSTKNANEPTIEVLLENGWAFEKPQSKTKPKGRPK